MFYEPPKLPMVMVKFPCMVVNFGAPFGYVFEWTMYADVYVKVSS